MSKKSTTRDRVAFALVVSVLAGALAGGAGTILIFGQFRPLFAIIGALAGLGATGVNVILRYEVDA